MSSRILNRSSGARLWSVSASGRIGFTLQKPCSFSFSTLGSRPHLCATVAASRAAISMSRASRPKRLMSAGEAQGRVASVMSMRTVMTAVKSIATPTTMVGRSLSTVAGSNKMDQLQQQQASAPSAPTTSTATSSLEYSRPFTDLTNLQPTTLEAIQGTFGYESMSKVQAAVLSTCPTDRDLLVKAKTGTGKTLAFLVAALESLVKTQGTRTGKRAFEKQQGKIGCVVIAPTRELALQISEEAKLLLEPLGFGVQYLVGGESKGKQLDRIGKEAAEFVVATPGRMKDLLGNGDFAAKVQESRVLVLDEADTILQLGFRAELDAILETMPKDRQTFLFSATVDSNVESLRKVALHTNSKGQSPIIIDTVGSKEVNLNLATRQRYCLAPYQAHVALVRRIMNDHLLNDMVFEAEQELAHYKKAAIAAAAGKKVGPKDTTIGSNNISRNNKIMVFLPTTRGAQLYAKVFASLSMGKELSVFEMHSAKHQRDRTLTSRNFKKIKTPAVLFTSDVSARGVDYPGVGLVIQVGAPISLDHYIHRIGRTGRGDGQNKKKKQLEQEQNNPNSNNKKKKNGQGKDEVEEDQGKGVLILGELDQGFIEHQLKPSPLFGVVQQEHRYDDWESVVLGESLDRGFKRALDKVDEKLAKSAYTAFLGYNLTVGPRIGNTDRKKILQSADKYMEAFGVEERPAVSISFLERMGFMKYRTLTAEDVGTESSNVELEDRPLSSLELVDGTFPTINTRITKSSLGSLSSTSSSSSSSQGEGFEDDEPMRVQDKGNRQSRKERQEAFEERVGLPETEYIKINEAEWEDFVEFKSVGMPKLIEKLHSPKRMGHFGNRPSKKTAKIFSDNDGW